MKRSHAEGLNGGACARADKRCHPSHSSEVGAAFAKGRHWFTVPVRVLGFAFDRAAAPACGGQRARAVLQNPGRSFSHGVRPNPGDRVGEGMRAEGPAPIPAAEECLPCSK